MTAPHYSDVWQGIARRDPDRIAIRTGDRELSWGRFLEEASAVSGFLTRSGVGLRDAVAMLLYNQPEFLTVTFGSFAVGASPVALNYRLKAAELRALLVDCDAKVLVTATSFAAAAEQAADGLGIRVVTIDDGPGAIAGATPYGELLAAGGEMPAAAPRGADLRLYTGGTTGAPKAVMWDLDTLLEARRQSTWGVIGVTPPETTEQAVDIALDPATPPIVTLPLSPMLHGTAQSTTFAALTLGGTIVLQASASARIDEAYRLIRRYGVTRLTVAGDAIALPLVELAEQNDGLPDVRWVFSSGMRFSDDVKRRLHSVGDLEIIDLLAASEGGPFAFGTTRSVDDLPARFMMTPGAVLLDEQDRELPLEEGALGILGFRGILPTGYYGDPVKTAQTFRVIGDHRYIVPGDWARARGDGSIELLGRLSAVVNTGGEKVFPAEVEEVLLEHPSVGDAVVFGLPDPRFGEVVSAMVAPATGADVDTDAVLAFVAGRLAGFKKPRHLFVRPSLERSPTGKVPLARVKEDAMTELATAQGAR